MIDCWNAPNFQMQKEKSLRYSRRALGFEHQWILGMGAFYRGASSQVLMAGTMGKSFKMLRSIPQGCPLAPYLYIIATEALNYQIADRSWQIQGLCWEWGRPPVRKRSYNNLFCRKNLRMGDVKQRNTHRERHTHKEV